MQYKSYSSAATPHNFDMVRAIKKSSRHAVQMMLLSISVASIQFILDSKKKCLSMVDLVKLTAEASTALSVLLAASPFLIFSTKWPLSASSHVSYSTVNLL